MPDPRIQIASNEVGQGPAIGRAVWPPEKSAPKFGGVEKRPRRLTLKSASPSERDK